jgi:hypothetical protein
MHRTGLVSFLFVALVLQLVAGQDVVIEIAARDVSMLGRMESSIAYT